MHAGARNRDGARARPGPGPRRAGRDRPRPRSLCTSGRSPSSLLVADVHDGVVVELHREVVPHAAQHQFALTDAVALGLADGPHAPRAVAGPPAAVGRHARGRPPPTDERARPATRSGPGAGCRRRPCPCCACTGAARSMAGMWPSQVTSMATRVLGGLDHHAEPAQGLEHLDAERPDGEVAAVGQRRRGAHDVLRAAVADVDERVDHAEVRVLAVAEDGEPVTRARVHVEVVAVVEVAVARRRGGR